LGNPHGESSQQADDAEMAGRYSQSASDSPRKCGSVAGGELPTPRRMTTYPSTPGYKVAGPSQDAAKATGCRVQMLQIRILALLSCRPMTADECAENMDETVLSIRPRFSELLAEGHIEASGLRRPNASGHKATVWKLVEQQPKQAELI
jgi:hypothetical protein